MHGILRALKAPSFARLAGTYALNEIADWFASIALAVLVYEMTGSALATTALFVCNRFLPAFPVPGIAARLDSLPTARTLAAIYVVEALVLTALAMSVTVFVLPVVLLFAFVDGTLAATARATTRSATQALMEPKGLLREGNAAMNLSFSSMNAGAPVVAGVLVAAIGAGAVLAISAALFAVQAVTIIGARDLKAGEPEAPPWRESLAEGLQYVRGHAFLRTFLASQTLVIVLLMMIPPIYIVYAEESLGVGETGYGVLLATWGAGMVLGGVVFARERTRSILTLIVVGAGAQGLAYIGIGLAPTLVVACSFTVIGGIGNGVHWVAVVTAVQEATADRFQGRVAGLLESLVTGAPGIGFLLGGAVTALADPRVALVVSGGGVVLVLAVGALLARPVAPAPAPVPEPSN